MNRCDVVMFLSYKQLKWLILIIPSITIGLWEYVRHEFLLPYISMDLGNILSPFLVLVVTLIISTQLFSMIEHIQEQLNESKSMEAVLKEREKIAQQLHDGIAQSLFFINIQINQLEKKQAFDGEALRKLKETTVRANEYVRQAIAALRYTANTVTIPWLESIESLIKEIKSEIELNIITKWNIAVDLLNEKEKVELLAIMREVLLNIYKHANATDVEIKIVEIKTGWICEISDNGIEFLHDRYDSNQHFGIKIMKDRAKAMNWKLQFSYIDDLNIVKIIKGDEHIE